MISSRLSKRYAKALFSIGQEDGRFAQYGRDLDEFSGFCREHAEFGQVIANPVFTLEDRRQILKSVLDKSAFSGTVKNFLYLLLDKGRIGAVEGISRYYARLSDEMSNIARAEIVTAMPLKEDALKRIEKTLEGITSKTIKSEVREDRDLIGGIVVKIGDLVLDGSVKAQLEGLKESLKRGEFN